jgi:sec-independent protein translocase protein TatB
VFGFSFSEVVLIGIVTLVAVGPQRLPGMLKNLATWIKKLRKMTIDVRQQTGIDDLLKAEGLHGGLSELRTIMRGGGAAPAPAPYRPAEDPYNFIEIDLTREYPPEGPDANGALPDDLVADEPSTAPVAPVAPPAVPPAVPPAAPPAAASPTPTATPGTTPGPTPGATP